MKAAAILVLLICALIPLPVSPQTRTEERVETGRFGTEEQELPEESAEGEEFNLHWLYLGFRAGPSLRMYTPSGDIRYSGGDTRAISLDTALQAELRALSFLGIQTELVFTWDTASLWAYRAVGAANEVDRYTKDYTALSFQIPLIVKFDFYPGAYKVSPFFGMYYFAPLGKLKASNSINGDTESLRYKVSPPFGLLCGLSWAVRAGSGFVFADLRYGHDLGDFRTSGGDIQEFKRSMISLSIGYELGFFTQKKGGGP